MAMEVTAEPVRSFEDFYRAEWPGLRRAVALVLGDRELAGAGVDVAMGRACERWDRVVAGGRPAAWVFREAVEEARRRGWRDGGRGRTVAVLPAGRVVADPELAAALARLPLEQRSLVVLRFFLDWSAGDVAAALGVSAGSVASRQQRAMRRLETALGESA